MQEEFYVDPDSNRYVFKADMDDQEAFAKYPGLVWEEPGNLPLLASRILLKVINIRAEHLRDISEEDAKAEGMEKIGFNYRNYAGEHPKYTARESFLTLMYKIYGEKFLTENPYVWVIEFEILKNKLLNKKIK